MKSSVSYFRCLGTALCWKINITRSYTLSLLHTIINMDACVWLILCMCICIPLLYIYIFSKLLTFMLYIYIYIRKLIVLTKPSIHTLQRHFIHWANLYWKTYKNQFFLLYRKCRLSYLNRLLHYICEMYTISLGRCTCVCMCMHKIFRFTHFCMWNFMAIIHKKHWIFIIHHCHPGQELYLSHLNFIVVRQCPQPLRKVSFTRVTFLVSMSLTTPLASF